MIRFVRFAAVGAAALTMSALLAACGPTPHNVGLAGSDTTYGVMGSLANSYKTNSTANPNGDTVSNIPPTLGDVQGSLYTGTNYKVPADAGCPGVTYNEPSGPNNPPNGSGNGRSALAADTNGCIDAARSSSFSTSATNGTGAGLEFWAYAVDALTWAKFPGTHAPANLTQAQLEGIYDCGASPGGTPSITDWHQVNAAVPTGTPIIRYLPQSGSGTRQFFESKILGGMSQAHDETNCADLNVGGTGHQLITHSTGAITEENDGTIVSAANKVNAILPYSFAVWTSQGNGLNGGTTVRNGTVLGSINGKAPSTATVALTSTCTTNCFFGNRLVYNVTKPGSPQYSNAINFLGVDSSHAGYVCSNNTTVKNAISAFGFVPLPVGATGTGLVNSTCRRNLAAP